MFVRDRKRHDIKTGGYTMTDTQTKETIKIGKYTVNIIEENQPSEAAIQNTNRRVNETMNKRVAS